VIDTIPPAEGWDRKGRPPRAWGKARTNRTMADAGIYNRALRSHDELAVTERAKGILMERHSVDDTAAFEMLRHHSRAGNRKLVDIAAAVVDGHA
jgi:ANTAR domain-containing protein